MYVYLNEVDKVCECYRCLKKVIKAHLPVGFSKHFSLNVNHLNDSIFNWKCCNQAQLLKQKNNGEVSCDYIFCMKFFAATSSKNIVATLRIVTIEISELRFLLIVYFHGMQIIQNLTLPLPLVCKFRHLSTPHHPMCTINCRHPRVFQICSKQNLSFIHFIKILWSNA